MAGQFARHLCVNNSKLFHTSAVYATALNTVTLPFRMEVSGPTATSQERGVGSNDMSNMVRLVSCSQQKKVALLEAAFPGPTLPGVLPMVLYVIIFVHCRAGSIPDLTIIHAVNDLIYIRCSFPEPSRGFFQA